MNTVRAVAWLDIAHPAQKGGRASLVKPMCIVDGDSESWLQHNPIPVRAFVPRVINSRVQFDSLECFGSWHVVLLVGLRGAQ